MPDGDLAKRFKSRNPKKPGYFETNKLPYSVISYICTETDINFDQFCTSNLADFNVLTADIVAAGFQDPRHLTIAERYYQRNRPDLQHWISKYYSSVQRAPPELEDFPLVVSDQYICKPLLLDPSMEARFLHYDSSFFDDKSFITNEIREAQKTYFNGETYLAFRSAFREQESSEKPGTFNGYSYRLLNIEPTEPFPHLHFARSQYFSYINTCEAKAFEAAYFKEIIQNNPTADARLSDSFRFRRKPSEIFQLSNRNAIVGVNTLTIVVNKGKDIAHFLQHDRDRTHVGEAIDTTHVVPAGTFQPLISAAGADKITPLNSSAWQDDFSLIETMVREFLEECLCLENQIKSASERGYWKNDPILQPLYRRLKLAIEQQVQAKAWFFGVGIDALTEKPELLTVLVIDASFLQTLAPTFSWNQEGNGHQMLFTKDELQTIIKSKNNRWLSAGMACIQLADKYFNLLRNCLDKPQNTRNT